MKKKKRIPNYDPDFLTTTDYKQGHPCMPTDVFRMLICGPSNSGKTNILLHVLNELLEYDKVYLFSKNLHQNKYRALLPHFATKIDPEVSYEVIEAAGDEIIPLEELPVDNQKVVVFDDLVCESNQNKIINYFINGRHKNCSVIYLTQTFYKVPKNTRDNCSHFCISSERKQANRGRAWGGSPTAGHRSRQKILTPSFTMKNHRNCEKKFNEDMYNGLHKQCYR